MKPRKIWIYKRAVYICVEPRVILAFIHFGDEAGYQHRLFIEPDAVKKFESNFVEHKLEETNPPQFYYTTKKCHKKVEEYIERNKEEVIDGDSPFNIADIALLYADFHPKWEKYINQTE